MKTVTKTITFSRKTSSVWSPDAEDNKKLINSNIIVLRRLFRMWGFVSLNQIKQCFFNQRFIQAGELFEGMYVHT